MTTNQDREAIIALHKRGKKPKDIISALKLPQSTVYKAIKRYKELGTSEDRPRSGRPVTEQPQPMSTKSNAVFIEIQYDQCEKWPSN